MAVTNFGRLFQLPARPHSLQRSGWNASQACPVDFSIREAPDMNTLLISSAVALALTSTHLAA
ncbi:hypothetical protein, partial [Paracoccus aerius]|uniref:hypothetical protein n=1 Tax=Paracoccus aerius TaxID=1915382 RepID=UPI001F48E782